MRRERDMRHRSSRTGRYVSDRHSEPMRREMRPRRDYGYDDYMPYDSDPRRGRDYRSRSRRDERDYGEYEDDCYLTDRELMEWSKDLMRGIPDGEKGLFAKDLIEKKAKELGISFEDFTFGELYVTIQMLYTDYYKTLGGGNLELYIKLARDFLQDSDLDIDGGEKLALYYDYIVCDK